MAGNYEEVVLLLHCEDDDAGTDIIDSSFSGSHTITANGAAQIDTAQYVFGTSSLLLGTNNFGTTPDDQDFNFGNNDFGIDLRARFTDVSGNIGICQQYASARSRAGLIYDQANGWLALNVTTGGATVIDVQAAWSPQIDTWYHIAVMRSGNYFHIYVDGTDLTSSGGTDSSLYPNIAAPYSVGRYTGGGGTTWYVPGWIDEFRMVNGTAPVTYSSDPLYICPCSGTSLSEGFNPPSEPYSEITYYTSAIEGNRDYTVPRTSEIDALRNFERDRVVSSLDSLRDNTVMKVAEVDTQRDYSGGYITAEVDALRDSSAMRVSELDANRDRLSMVNARVEAHSERHARLGYYVWSRDMADDSLTNEGYIDQGGTELTGVALADGTYHIELRPSGYFWPEARDAEIYAAKVVDGSLSWWLPPVEDLTATRQSGKTRLRWRWPGYSGAQTPDSFGLWFGTAAGVDTSGTATGSVEYEAAGVYQYTRTHATAEVAAVAGVLDGTVGDVSEIDLTIPSSALPPVIPQWVEEST